MSGNELVSILDRLPAEYEAMQGKGGLTVSDTATLSRRTDGEFAVWRLGGGGWTAAGTILCSDLIAWNARQMERFYSDRSSGLLQLTSMPDEPQRLASSRLVHSQFTNPTSLLDFVCIVWDQLYGPDKPARPLWCEPICLANSMATAAEDRAEGDGLRCSERLLSLSVRGGDAGRVLQWRRSPFEDGNGSDRSLGTRSSGW